MIAEALKKALLQAAIQGKLTEQLPEDGDARDLLKEIEKEKTRLVKEGKIKREKPLPEITEDKIPFDIPENWTWVRLGDLILLKSGQDMTPDKYHSKMRGIPYITGASNFNNGNVTIDRWTETPRSIAHEGDLLITCKGTVGEMAFLRESQAHIARQVMAIKSVGTLNLRYVHYLLKWFVTELISMAKSLIPGISREMVLTIVTPLPPLQEQERIVKKLELLLTELEDLKVEENKIDDLEKAFPGKIRSSILQSAIQGKLTEQLPEDGDARELLKEIQKEKARLIKEGKIKKANPLPEITEDEIPFDIPENWVWVRLGDYIDFIIGKTPSRGESSYWGNDLPWVSISDMNGQPVIRNTKEKISNKAFTTVFNGKIVPKGTLLMSFKLTIGRMSFLGIDALHNEAIISINPIVKNLISDNYLFKVLPFFAQTGETKGAIKGETLNSSSIRRLLFPLAPLSEQDRIIQKLDELLPLCTSVETTSY